MGSLRVFGVAVRLLAITVVPSALRAPGPAVGMWVH